MLASSLLDLQLPVIIHFFSLLLFGSFSRIKCFNFPSPQIPGFFTPSDDLAKDVLAASEVSGEKLWRLPLEDSYWESMKSGVADMVNTGGRQGGAITAALFLKQVLFN